MGPDCNKHLRNIAIIIALALVVWLLPGGQAGSQTILNILGVIFWGGLVFLAYRLYMEHRMTLMDLEDRTRMLLYFSFGLLAITLIATSRMWQSGGLGALGWFVLMGAAIYGLVTVYRVQREY